MNMLLHRLPDARTEKGDTIRDPKLVEEAELLLYDRVIANPPRLHRAFAGEVNNGSRVRH